MASILATISGTPSILYGTDSHKTRALHNDLGIEGRFYELNELPVYKDEIVQRLISEKKKKRDRPLKFANEQRNLLKKFYLDL